MSHLLADEDVARLTNSPITSTRRMAVEIELSRAKIKELRATLVRAHDGILAGLDDKELIEILGNYGGVNPDERKTDFI